ncbi:acyl-CoA synthetase [Actinosynnema pretiosum subsp. pretiosum]|uniref:AMP-dependent synthetase and ligase n=2 Tax=Actinosynnema TaxID=40566 RepID=C6WLW6_ACTMD|nr:acyl-CoA synthetase [Actinosynnema mirum]ACU40351.1 AMP-dependent synthetase and ligase [Actinosynnema mirum DSM 43827]AXX33861.1 putative fatty acid synthase [Actinosynnema pretiosum subsp. pretiosum]QUF02379.1 acyl-CoA synthetase [Actinosynnema pretiosum subsp. pretiosum]
MLLPALTDAAVADAVADKTALRFPDGELTYRELAARARAVAHGLAGRRLVAVWARPTLDTCVTVVGALLAGVPVVPLNPRIGERELRHVLEDSAPELVVDGEPPSGAEVPLPEPDAEAPALVIYTSGTTGPPKGVVLPRRALAANLDALAAAWAWTGDDVVVHGLPLFHVHGLCLGVLGPLRRGGTVRHLGSFTVEAAAEALAGDGTVLFGVPTMYHRLAQAPEHAEAFGKARLLVSGSAALPAAVHERISALTGQRVVERYGMTETLIITSVRADGDRRPGAVGTALDGTAVRVVGEPGEIGEVEVRGPGLFTEYLNRPDATREAFRDGWFRTGDLAVLEPDGYLRIVGRRATDLIKSGGYKIGAGEIENALLEHPDVAEVAVVGEPDEDLGERVVAWVVADGREPTLEELADHVAGLLAPHKRPRALVLVDSLPRNDLGKVLKRELRR